MLLWVVRFVADGTRRNAFFKEPILEHIFCESNSLKNILIALDILYQRSNKRGTWRNG